jgi:2-(1,2-epoxy-1,2-dihydrophenyl)acetyl-CoA isomerase
MAKQEMGKGEIAEGEMAGANIAETKGADGPVPNFECVDYQVGEGVARLTLNRPNRLNAFTVQMLAEMKAALALAANDGSVRALVITGAGKGFCAGQDLSERKREPGAPPADLGESLGERYNPMILAIRSMDKPVICAVNGVAAGAGVGLSLACDIVLAARSAKFVLSFSRLGLVPDSGATWSLQRLVGRARALGLALLGETVTAKQAEDWGLIWKCVDDGDLLAEAQALAVSFNSKPPIGIGLLKQALNAGGENALEAQLDVERDLQRVAGNTEDYQEAVAAFMEKRDPKFTGK